MKPTSQKHVIIDVEVFLRFASFASVPKVRLTGRAINGILARLKAWKKGLGAQIVIQRLDYKRRKRGEVQCRETGRTDCLLTATV